MKVRPETLTDANGWPRVTAENLTDAQILAFGRSHRDGTFNDAIARELCVRALGLGSPSDPPDFVTTARTLIADAINFRSEAP